jgi:hypothetical protein
MSGSALARAMKSRASSTANCWEYSHRHRILHNQRDRLEVVDRMIVEVGLRKMLVAW